jgi:DNA-binding CsgD family transcriptional regulator
VARIGFPDRRRHLIRVVRSCTGEIKARLEHWFSEQPRILALIHATRAAEAMLRKADTIRSVGGQLCSLGMSQTECLIKLIRDAAATAAGGQGSAGGTVSILRLGRLPVTVLVAPFRPTRCGAGAAVPAAILFMRDPEHSQSPSERALRELFGLTPAEATITVQLARGSSLAQVAARHRLSSNTVHTHLKNIFGKTGINRQSQLTAVILNSVAVLNPREPRSSAPPRQPGHESAWHP